MATVDSDGRVRIVTLTPAGRRAKTAFERVVWETEAKWRSRFVDSRVLCLRRALENVVVGEAGEALLAEAMTAPPGGWRESIKKPDTLPWQPMVLHRGGYPDGS